MVLSYIVFRMVVSKKGQSQIIASILLILIVITTAVIIMGVVVPFVKKQLAETNCLDVAAEVEIKNNPKYTYYDGREDKKELSIQIWVGNNKNIKGFQVVVNGGGSSESFKIVGGPVGRVRMFNIEEETLELPEKNEERTYVISDIAEKPDSVTIYSILEGGKTCGIANTLNYVDDRTS